MAFGFPPSQASKYCIGQYCVKRAAAYLLGKTPHPRPGGALSQRLTCLCWTSTRWYSRHNSPALLDTADLLYDGDLGRTAQRAGG